MELRVTLTEQLPFGIETRRADDREIALLGDTRTQPDFPGGRVWCDRGCTLE